MTIRRSIHPFVCLFVLAASTIVGFVSTSVSAATVTNGACSTEVDNATGVTMTVALDGDCALSFTRTGTTTWTVPNGVTAIRTLIIGGGGGGGFDIGGGGGAGGVREVTSVSTTPGETATIQVGTGGNGDTSRGVPCVGDNGTPSSIAVSSGNLSAIGGGGGGGQDGGGACATDGITGASGGGGGVGISWPRVGGIGTYGTDSDATTFGNSGGRASLSSYYAGGGGGGAGGLGGAGSANGSGAVGGTGGIGRQSNISGSNITYAGGGAGGFFQSGTRGLGGSGGGGAGGTGGIGPVVGTDGLGGGGGGGGVQNGVYGQGAKGGSGVVIVRYSMPADPTNSVAPVVSGTTRNGSTLSTTTGSWTGTPTSYAYQWQRASASGGSFTNIPSAISSLYDLTDADIDKYIRVSVVATNSVGSTTVSSAATSIVVDLPDSDVPTATTPVATATGFTFTISNYSNLYTYSLTSSKGSVSRSLGDVTVSGLVAGESATVTIAVTRASYKPASKAVTGSAIPAPALSIVIQAPVTTVAQGQGSVATLAPTTTVPVLSSGKTAIPTTTVAPSKTVVTTTMPPTVTTTTIGPPVVGKVATGQTAVQVDGVDTKAQVSRVNNQLVVSAGALKATIGGVNENGSAMSLDSDGNVRLRPGDVVRIKLAGFKPGSTVEAWLFSTPVLMGASMVGVDGSVTGNFVVPKNASQGAHRIAVVAKAVDGKPTTFTVGVAVGVVSETSTWTRVLIAIPITLAIGFGFLLPNQLRRRRKIRTT